MNYRRGFQRIYAVIAVAWIALALAVLPSSRLKFWARDAPPELTPDSFMAQPPPPPSGVTFQEDQKNGIVLLEKSLWLVGVLLLPPIVGYIALFEVIPWIYHGFRPGVKNS